MVEPETGDITEWLYEAGSQVQMNANSETAVSQAEDSGPSEPKGREVVLQTPISEEQIRSLRVGDVVVIRGEMHTGRDALHKYLMDHDAPIDLNGSVIYHCGPVMMQDEEGWHVKAAGPTTSIREEPYQGDILKNSAFARSSERAAWVPRRFKPCRSMAAYI